MSYTNDDQNGIGLNISNGMDPPPPRQKWLDANPSKWQPWVNAGLAAWSPRRRSGPDEGLSEMGHGGRPRAAPLPAGG